jgi:endoglucanase
MAVAMRCLPITSGLLLGLVLHGGALMAEGNAGRPAAKVAPQASLAIKVDQVGYLPDARKVALVSAPGSRFSVRRAKDGAVVLEGRLSEAVPDKDSGDRLAVADFSALKESGEFYLDIPGVGRSWSFAIAPNVYERTYYLGMRAFYGQRCGTAVDLGPEFPEFKYPACHLQGAFHASSGQKGRRDNIGGWHDAGDYGRYIVNSSITVANLMWTWELYGPKVQKINLRIPESGKGTPDILAETRWNLEWMLKMQDVDGGVFHKQTSEGFVGFIAPHKDKTVSYVIGTGAEPFKNTTASADFAASMAIAARVYPAYDAAFAAQALQAAERAWKWAVAHPAVPFMNPKGVATGGYGDHSFADELLWASAELWRTTGKAEYNDYFLAHWGALKSRLAGSSTPQGLEITPNWGEVTPMALWTYAMADRGDEAARSEIRRATVDLGRQTLDDVRANGYLMALKSKDYRWGSNSAVATCGIRLLMADHFAPDPAFQEAVRDNLHYLLGRNAFSLSFVTQVGENPYRHPHHRPSGETSQPWPGLLSGGPNAHREDAALAKLPKDTPPAKCFVDVLDSYASNEIAINWQSAFVFLVSSQLP